jgi:hypothetical protein
VSSALVIVLGALAQLGELFEQLTHRLRQRRDIARVEVYLRDADRLRHLRRDVVYEDARQRRAACRAFPVREVFIWTLGADRKLAAATGTTLAGATERSQPMWAGILGSRLAHVAIRFGRERRLRRRAVSNRFATGGDRASPVAGKLWLRRLQDAAGVKLTTSPIVPLAAIMPLAVAGAYVERSDSRASL